jgi:hypothetical protein
VARAARDEAAGWADVTPVPLTPPTEDEQTEDEQTG